MSQHGGKREGAGRRKLGIRKKITITLEEEIWEEIDRERKEKPLASFVREIIQDRYESKGG